MFDAGTPYTLHQGTDCWLGNTRTKPQWVGFRLNLGSRVRDPSMRGWPAGGLGPVGERFCRLFVCESNLFVFNIIVSQFINSVRFLSAPMPMAHDMFQVVVSDCLSDRHGFGVRYRLSFVPCISLWSQEIPSPG